MFYWSEENFRTAEEELHCKIVECCSFTRNVRYGLEHAAFATEDGRFYYMYTTSELFQVYETNELVYEGYMEYTLDDNGMIALYNRHEHRPYLMKHVTDLAMDFFEDVEPEEMRLKDTRQVVIVGKEPEETKGLFRLQAYDYEKGHRTVWIDDYTRKNPIIIDDSYDDIFLPDRILEFIEDIDSVADMRNDEAEEEYDGVPVFYYKIEFVYEDRYYIMVPSATAMTVTAFAYIDELINRYLIEMGCPYVRTYITTTDMVGSD